MNLVFLDRTAAKPAAGESFLNIRQDGTFTLSAGAIQQHQLSEHRWVSLAKDTDTNTYYLVFGSGTPDRKPYSLRANKAKASGRTFSAAAPAKQLWQAFPAGPDAKSLRLVIGAPTAHEVGPLFPLSPEGQPAPATVAPATVAPEPPVPTATAEVVTPVPESAPAPSAPAGAFSELQETVLAKIRTGASPTALVKGGIAGYNGTKLAAWRKDPVFLNAYDDAKLAGWNLLYGGEETAVDEPAPEPVAPAPVVEAEPEPEPEPAAVPRKTFGLQARAEELTTYWIERDIERTTPSELGEILNLMRHVPRDKRSFEMGVVLERAEKEHTERLKGAGKGGNRG
jgi:hypothetical protein